METLDVNCWAPLLGAIAETGGVGMHVVDWTYIGGINMIPSN